jgi:DNA-binding transcriptional MocR family regulator
VAARCGEVPVAVVGSLSKVVWGGLRLGFVRAPEPLALRFARVKATGDLGSSAVSQLLAERLLSGPEAVWSRRSGELRHRYQVLADALGRRLPSWHFDEPAGGLSLWVSLDGVDAERFAQTALRHGRAATATGSGCRSPRHAPSCAKGWSDWAGPGRRWPPECSGCLSAQVD